MFPTALLMLSLDQRDPAVIQAIVENAGHLGIQRILVAHIAPRDAIPSLFGEVSGLGAAERPEPFDRALADLRRKLPDVEFTGLHGTGSPVDETDNLVAQENIDLLVIGRSAARKREDSDTAVTTWGRVGRTLIRLAAMPTLVVPQGARLSFEHAVVGLDFSDHAFEALDMAVRLFDRVDAYYQYSTRNLGLRVSEKEFVAQIRKHATEHFEQDLLPRLPDGAHPVLHVVEALHASKALVDTAGTEPIVIGSRGLSKLAARLLGSTAERVARTSAGPVLIVRKKGERLGLIAGLIHR